jgi:hypothetical protein
MSPAARWIAVAVGALAIAWLLTRLPADVLAATKAALYVAASAILLLVAAAVVLRPARALERALFGLPLRADGPFFGVVPEREMRAALRPLVVAGICFGVAVVAGLIRA